MSTNSISSLIPAIYSLCFHLREVFVNLVNPWFNILDFSETLLNTLNAF
jgi:hypothetical protein